MNSRSRIPYSERNNWRRYQDMLKRREDRIRRKKRTTRASIIFLGLLALGGTVYFGLLSPKQPDATLAQREVPAPLLTKADLSGFLSRSFFLNPRSDNAEILIDDKPHQVLTSLDPQLQQHLLQDIASTTSRERYCSRFIGAVAMGARSGRVLAMASFDKNDPQHNVCLSADYPAASVFKIITAAAAINAFDYHPGSIMRYNGQPYTLYYGQIKDRENRYTRKLTLKEAFAKSINPVFGKLGANTLGKSSLQKYGELFGFNEGLSFDTAVATSTLMLLDNGYQWAEVASGFNKTTLISPLHGAVLVATVLNEGSRPEPSLIDGISDMTGKTVYQRPADHVVPVISSPTSRRLVEMMQATVSSGTGRKCFRGYKKDDVLSGLTLGGKTGTMNNNPRYDWFVGFGSPKGRPEEAVVVAVMVAHENYIGKKAGAYARLMLKDVFSRRLEQGLSDNNSGDFRE